MPVLALLSENSLVFGQFHFDFKFEVSILQEASQWQVEGGRHF